MKTKNFNFKVKPKNSFNAHDSWECALLVLSEQLNCCHRIPCKIAVEMIWVNSRSFDRNSKRWKEGKTFHENNSIVNRQSTPIATLWTNFIQLL